jgi:hypothetical protein
MSKCKYGTRAGGILVCDYIGIEGHSRGCSPEACDKFGGKRRRRKREEGTGPEEVKEAEELLV